MAPLETGKFSLPFSSMKLLREICSGFYSTVEVNIPPCDWCNRSCTFARRAVVLTHKDATALKFGKSWCHLGESDFHSQTWDSIPDSQSWLIAERIAKPYDHAFSLIALPLKIAEQFILSTITKRSIPLFPAGRW